MYNLILRNTRRKSQSNKNKNCAHQGILHHYPQTKLHQHCNTNWVTEPIKEKWIKLVWHSKVNMDQHIIEKLKETINNALRHKKQRIDSGVMLGRLVQIIFNVHKKHKSSIPRHSCEFTSTFSSTLAVCKMNRIKDI